MREQLRLFAALTWVIVADWWWLPFAVALGIAMWLLNSTSGDPAPAWVHVGAALIGCAGGRWAYRWVENRGARQACPHPLHRIRHIHGDDEHRSGPVAQCMECRRLFRDWPGGHHDATRCWTG